jgi:serine/threonine protein kinase
MSKKSIFGLEPGQLDQLLSLGTDVEDQPKDPHLKPPMQAGREEAGVAPSVQEPSDADARAAGDVGPASRAGPEGVGDWIGPYKLLRILGEGGMGIVYLADQKGSICRQVALKIVKPGMDSKRVITRFEAEQKALAMMEHPHIARVYDAGLTLSGRPYFVMEYIKGVPITEYCDKCRLTIEERLHLFLHVCGAVQHAHQKGIIHRDLKPSNILVTLIDGEPVPKVIDFGVAKALGRKLTDKTLFTGFLKMVGTPAYMSPEQADLSGVDIDTRADIYALGVLLYELLTGVTPFDGETLRNAALDEIRRLIRET